MCRNKNWLGLPSSSHFQTNPSVPLSLSLVHTCMYWVVRLFCIALLWTSLILILQLRRIDFVEMKGVEGIKSESSQRNIHSTQIKNISPFHFFLPHWGMYFLFIFYKIKNISFHIHFIPKLVDQSEKPRKDFTYAS